MNLPNKLTLSRFALTVGFLIVMFASNLPYHETLALAFFVAAHFVASKRHRHACKQRHDRKGDD